MAPIESTATAPAVVSLNFHLLLGEVAAIALVTETATMIAAHANAEILPKTFKVFKLLEPINSLLRKKRSNKCIREIFTL